MAFEPINYEVQVKNPFDSVIAGYKNATTIRDDQQKQAQALAEQAQAQQYQAEVSAALRNPTPQAFSALAVKYPQHREAFKQGWDTLNTAQQQSELKDASAIAATLHAGRHDLALQQLDQRIEAAKNSGMPTGEYQALRDQIESNPQEAYGMTLHVISSLPGGDKVLTNLSTIGTEKRAADEAPAVLAKKVADAEKAGIDAKYAEQGAVIDLQKKGWDIKKIQEDIEISKQANRIAAMNAAAAREGNALKREELKLKIAETRQALDDKIRTKVADAEASATTIDNSLNTIERLKRNKSLNDVVGSIEGRVPSVFSDEGADAISLIETLGSQAFLSQATNLKGMGALSNAEGEKLQSALTNLRRTQSEEQFRANLDEASRLLKKGRETLSKRTGVPLGSPDTPAAPGSRPPLSSFGGR